MAFGKGGSLSKKISGLKTEPLSSVFGSDSGSVLSTKMPTNGDAAKRGYCIKHSRALLDIGEEKKCTACRDEQRAREKEKAGS